jgi:hypothetical protein
MKMRKIKKKMMSLIIMKSLTMMKNQIRMKSLIMMKNQKIIKKLMKIMTKSQNLKNLNAVKAMCLPGIQTLHFITQKMEIHET